MTEAHHHPIILIDLGSVGVDVYSGIGQIAIQYVRYLAAIGQNQFGFSLLLRQDIDTALFDDAFPVAYSRRPLSNRIARIFDKSREHHVVYDTNKHRLRHALQSRAALPAFADSTPLVLTIHDAIQIQERSQKAATRSIAKMRRAISRADVLVFISTYTQKIIGDFCDISQKPQRVIYNGVEAPSVLQKPEWFKDGLPFLLSIGRIVSYKNVHLLAAMMAQLPEYSLIIVGPDGSEPAYVRKVSAVAESAGVAERVILSGKISESEKAWLYQNCAALMMPSRNEGFGMPIIEAFHFGKPVFSSRYAALPEVGGSCAFYWDDMEPTAMAALVRENMSTLSVNSADQIDRRKKWAESFSWQRNINAYLDLYREILNVA